MQYWQYEGRRVYHEKFGFGKCTGTDDGNIIVDFDQPTDGYKSRSLQHTNVKLIDIGEK